MSRSDDNLILALIVGYVVYKASGSGLAGFLAFMLVL